jgi:hypothetical protein
MSDKGDKSRLGFKTTATELQDRFEKLLEEVENKDKLWSEFSEFAASTGKEMNEKITSEASIGNLVSIVETEFLATLSIIGLLGRMLAQIEGRVVDLEKSIERLHLKVK